MCYNNSFVLISGIINILKETPNKYEVFRLLYKIREKWYDIGLSLQVRQNVLDNLKCSQKFDVEKLFAVIDNVLTTQLFPVTWETIIAAIESPIVNKKELADIIRQYLSTSKSHNIFC